MKLRAGSVAFNMYFRLMYSPEIVMFASGRKSTRKLVRQRTELMVLIDHELVGNSTSSPFAFPSCPFPMGIWLTLGKRGIGAT